MSTGTRIGGACAQDRHDLCTGRCFDWSAERRFECGCSCHNVPEGERD